LNLRKAFENRQDRLLSAFKIGEMALAGFQNFVSWLWLPFKISELALASIQNRRNGSGRLSKALGAAMRNLLSNRSKGFELAGFKKLFANSKGFGAKWQRIY
jgi:hypothetical protein